MKEREGEREGRERERKSLIPPNSADGLVQILEAIGVDYIDESEVLTPADNVHHVVKHPFKVPFVCGCRNLGEALRRISEGAAMSTLPSLPRQSPRSY